jgi:hypothetical protein
LLCSRVGVFSELRSAVRGGSFFAFFASLLLEAAGVVLGDEEARVALGGEDARVALGGEEARVALGGASRGPLIPQPQSASATASPPKLAKRRKRGREDTITANLQKSGAL